MNDLTNAMMEQDEAQQKTRERDGAVLDQVRAMVTPEVFSDIEICIKESGYAWDFKITDKPRGVEQDEDFAFGTYYVNQTTNGGWSGDEYAGTVSIPVGNGKYFQFDYSM